MFDWLFGGTSTDALGNVIGTSPGLIGDIGSGLAKFGSAALDGIKSVGDFAGLDGKFGYNGTWSDAATKISENGVADSVTNVVKEKAGDTTAPWLKNLGLAGTMYKDITGGINQNKATKLLQNQYNRDSARLAKADADVEAQREQSNRVWGGGL